MWEDAVRLDRKLLKNENGALGLFQRLFVLYVFVD